jgi:hypothetical protein
MMRFPGFCQLSVGVQALACHVQLRRLKPARDDARYQGKVCVWYPYHPLCGKQNLSILRRVGSPEVEYLEIHSADGRQCVPAWMLDADCCAQMTCGLQPTVDLSSLMEVADWLRALDL